MTTKIILLYWQPGSGGDHLQQMLLYFKNQVQGVAQSSIIDDNGRVNQVLSAQWKEMFPPGPEGWYLRKWSTADAAKLKGILPTLKSPYFVIGTHDLPSINILKQSLGDSMISLGITYGQNMHPLILKNWCKKVGPVNVRITEHYTEAVHEYFKDKGVFGAQVLKDRLKQGNFVVSSQADRFDLSISMESMYINNFDKMLKSLGLIADSAFKDLGVTWLQNQSILHQCQFPRHQYFESAVGYNPLALVTTSQALPLDIYDNLLIRNWCKTNLKLTQLPRLNNTQQAFDFFNNLNQIR